MNDKIDIECVFASSIIDAKQTTKRKNATVNVLYQNTAYKESYY